MGAQLLEGSEKALFLCFFGFFPCQSMADVRKTDFISRNHALIVRCSIMRVDGM